MKINYDKATDSLYIHLSDRPSVDSDEVQDGVVLDFDANGALVGIDVQQPRFRTPSACHQPVSRPQQRRQQPPLLHRL